MMVRPLGILLVLGLGGVAHARLPGSGAIKQIASKTVAASHRPVDFVREHVGAGIERGGGKLSNDLHLLANRVGGAHTKIENALNRASGALRVASGRIGQAVAGHGTSDHPYLTPRMAASYSSHPDDLQRGTPAYKNFLKAAANLYQADRDFQRASAGYPNGGMATDPRTHSFDYVRAIKAMPQYQRYISARANLRAADAAIPGAPL